MRNKCGFTFIEVLVSILMFSLAFAALSYMHVLSIKGAGFGRQAMIATLAAQKQIERMTAADYESIQSDPVGIAVQPGMVMTWQVAETISPLLPEERFKSITLDVQWKGKKLRFNTLIPG